ncbi:MAG: hypothetical protein NXI20_13780 [bacterium]|nr:hypothetical protein [bacterium]
MKRYLAIFSLIYFSCTSNNSPGYNSNNHVVDTIYATNQENTPSYKRLTIQITGILNQDIPSFKVGESTPIRFQVIDFEEYPLFVKGTENVIVDKGDSLSGIYYLIPTDTTFKVEVSQNYGTGNVVLKTKREEGTVLLDRNGHNIVGIRPFKAQKNVRNQTSE